MNPSHAFMNWLMYATINTIGRKVNPLVDINCQGRNKKVLKES